VSGRFADPSAVCGRVVNSHWMWYLGIGECGGGLEVSTSHDAVLASQRRLVPRNFARPKFTTTTPTGVDVGTVTAGH
jgi:hypothetical protein